MPSLSMLLIVWAGITVVLIVLLIYRSTLTMHEDDQLFLSETESHMEREQRELLVKINKLQPIVRVFGVASGLLIVVIAGLWVWQGINQM